MNIQRSWRTAASALLMILPVAGGIPADERRIAAGAVTPVEPASTAQPAIGPTMLPAALRPPTLADNAGELAGLNVRLLNARIVEIFEPHAFVVESAPPRHRRMSDHRDRILVLLEVGTLRAPAEPMTAWPITIVGVARTLFGVRVPGEVAWPAALDADRIKRLQVRAAVLATSVQTAEGTELTDRR